MKKSKPEPVPVMDYRQYRRARRLVHECCNYDGGHCIALDDGEECVCVQSISYSLLCRWFRAAVLPLDRELETALFHRLDAFAFASHVTMGKKRRGGTDDGSARGHSVQKSPVDCQASATPKKTSKGVRQPNLLRGL